MGAAVREREGSAAAMAEASAASVASVALSVEPLGGGEAGCTVEMAVARAEMVAGMASRMASAGCSATLPAAQAEARAPREGGDGVDTFARCFPETRGVRVNDPVSPRLVIARRGGPACALLLGRATVCASGVAMSACTLHENSL